MPEVLLGLLRAPRQPRTKQDRHISAPSPDTGALPVLLGCKCLLSFHLGPCLHLKNQLSLCLIIQISFHSHQGSLLPSPCSWLCSFHLWEIQSFVGCSELARLDQKIFVLVEGVELKVHFCTCGCILWCFLLVYGVEKFQSLLLQADLLVTHQALSHTHTKQLCLLQQEICSISPPRTDVLGALSLENLVII